MNFLSFTADKLFQVIIALAAFALVIGLLMLIVDRSPKSRREKVAIICFLAPACILLLVGLVSPAIQTSFLAFTDKNGKFNGIDNFIWMFTSPTGLVSLRNTLIWTLIVPIFSTTVGLLYAVFIDKSRGEKTLKALVFMPMAISFVGAGIIWSAVYDYKGEDFEQTGILNALRTTIGLDPVQFLKEIPGNTFYLIAVMIWIQTGFAMVILSAAIKGIPAELTEAAKLDGANAWTQFWNITVPGIRGSLVVVMVTISIATLKVFDIIRTMTAGNYETSVIANEMYTQALTVTDQPGRGAALALVLFLMVLPIVIYNARVMKKQREIR